ncbi:hypothetical protein PR048_001200, partial [Dryococelus australis]
MKSIFAELGIPAVVMSDGGSNLTSSQFTKWNFIHQTSSPHYPQSNGMFEHHVQTVKKTLKKVIQDQKDVSVALLELRNTPVIQGHSPAQLLMGRRLRGCIPVVPALLNPFFPNHEKVHAALLAKACQPEEKRMTGAVRVQTSKGWVKEAVIIHPANRPRSYVMKMPSGNIVESSTRVLHPVKGVYLSAVDRDDIDVVESTSVNQGGRVQVERATHGINNHDVLHTNGFHGFTEEDCRVRVHDTSHSTVSDTSVEVQGSVNPVVNSFVDSGGDGAPITSKFGRVWKPSERYPCS